MVGELTPVAVDPQTAGPEFWKRFHELRRMRHAEQNPDDPFEPDEVTETRMKKKNPFDESRYFEISRDGVMLSWFTGENTTPKNPEHETNKHLFWADAYVRPDERRKGIAKHWLPLIARLMDEDGRTVVGASSEDETGRGFLRWVGAEPKLTEIESRLKLSEVDWEMMRRWVEEGAARSPRTRLELYDGLIPERLWPEFSKAQSELLNTMPLEDLDIGRIIVTPERMKFHYEQAALTGVVRHDAVTREPDGAISGMTDVYWAPYRRTLIEQGFTGVRPEARGRGLGKWIKAAMVLHVHELYPDAEWIGTGNAGSNAPMLKINRAMGFKPYKTHIDYQMTRDQLGRRLET